MDDDNNSIEVEVKVKVVGGAREAKDAEAAQQRTPSTQMFKFILLPRLRRLLPQEFLFNRSEQYFDGQCDQRSTALQGEDSDLE